MVVQGKSDIRPLTKMFTLVPESPEFKTRSHMSSTRLKLVVLILINKQANHESTSSILEARHKYFLFRPEISRLWLLFARYKTRKTYYDSFHCDLSQLERRILFFSNT